VAPITITMMPPPMASPSMEISDSTMPLNSINGVFLNNYAPTVPPTQTPNPILPRLPRWISAPQTERDYTNIAPDLQQVFSSVTENRGSNTQQTITVPSGATRFFLGTMDGWEWSNNIGGYNVTVTENLNHHCFSDVILDAAKRKIARNLSSSGRFRFE